MTTEEAIKKLEQETGEEVIVTTDENWGIMLNLVLDEEGTLMVHPDKKSGVLLAKTHTFNETLNWVPRNNLAFIGSAVTPKFKNRRERIQAIQWIQKALKKLKKESNKTRLRIRHYANHHGCYC